MRPKHLKLAVQDFNAVDLLPEVATDIAAGPARTRRTALHKDGWGRPQQPGMCSDTWPREPALVRTSSRCNRGLARMP